MFPVVLGDGKRLFADAVTPISFEVVESQTTSGGATYMALRPIATRGVGEFSVQDGRHATMLA